MLCDWKMVRVSWMKKQYGDVGYLPLCRPEDDSDSDFLCSLVKSNLQLDLQQFTFFSLELAMLHGVKCFSP